MPAVRQWLTTRWAVAAVLAIAVLLTIALLAAGVLSHPAQVTAYATAVLAVGAVGLAAGAVGAYLEQRETNRRQAGQVAAAEVADMAQVRIERHTGPGEFLEVIVDNASSRAIRDVYVWADVRGATGRYHLGIMLNSGVARGMRNVPHGPDLYWQFRSIPPGTPAIFDQLRHAADNKPVPASIPDHDITAYAEFIDVRGKWWRIDEDGNVNQVE
ncbi:MAG: hypothetical protein ACRDP7_15715, partial [Trebonia sp.]